MDDIARIVELVGAGVVVIKATETRVMRRVKTAIIELFDEASERFVSPTAYQQDTRVILDRLETIEKYLIDLLKFEGRELDE